MNPKIILYLLLLGATLQAQTLSPKQLEKAKKNAALEIKNLPPKGWEVNRSDMSFSDMMNEAWKLKFSMYNEDTPMYIYTFGNGSGKTAEEAFKKASSKAHEQLPGLTLLYFSTWNMAAKISDDERSKISQAINNAEKSINKSLTNMGIQPFVNMIQKKGSKTTVHLRYYYPQMKVREIARGLIMNELEKTSDWSKEKMVKLLTYDK